MFKVKHKNKTYLFLKGYINRQALYSCITCSPEARENPDKCAGVCLACSYKCHENHEMIELYTKRNFRCDCGTKKIPNTKCILNPLKLEENDKNLYNQNFSGLYCICHRPYPDPDETTEDEMIQCIVCEDWYHGRHLNTIVPVDTEYSEMICAECSKECEFLKYYQKYQVNSSEAESKNDEKDEVNVESPTDENEEMHKAVDQNDEDCPPIKQQKLDDDACTRPLIEPKEFQGATFWSSEWRTFLCKCVKCIQIYKQKNVDFIVDSEDTCLHYEEKGKNSADQETSFDVGMRALSSMNRVAQVEVLTGYNRLKDRLKDYLQEFVTNQQVVTENDINKFFAQLKNEDNGVHIPNSCR